MVKKKITKSTNSIVQVVRREVEYMREDAIWNGRRDDGGAGRLEEILEAWLAGMSGKTPSTLKKYEDIVHKENDPEWKEFQRLRCKFGD